MTQAGAIDRITPDGVISSYALPQGGGAPSALAAGPDGVWFTDPSAARVGRVDASGHVVEFGGPTPIIGGTGLAVGPDGAAYYQPQSGMNSYLVRISPDGVTTPIDLKGRVASTLFAGPGGVDLLDSGPGGPPRLDQVGPAGALTTLATSDQLPSSVTGLAFGAGGYLWFSQNGLGAIGRIDLGPAPAPGPTLVAEGLAPASPVGQPPGPGLLAPDGEVNPIALADFRHSADVGVESVTVDWGDGSAPTPGSIGAFPGGGGSANPFVDGEVSGSHAYTSAGPHAVTVTILGAGPGGATLTASVVETVSAVNPSPAPLTPPAVVAGKSIEFQGPVALFSTPTPHDASGSDFLATIDWGDGSAATTGKVVPSSAISPYPQPVPGTTLAVSGGHAYATTGLYRATVSVVGPDGQASRTTTTIFKSLSTAQVNATGSPLSLIQGLAIPASVLGTVYGMNGGGPADFRATVDWGDGTPPEAATLQPETSPYGPPSGASILAGHAYATPGTYTVAITATGTDGIPSRTTTQAIVSAAPTLLPVIVVASGHPTVGLHPPAPILAASPIASLSSSPSAIATRSGLTLITPAHWAASPPTILPRPFPRFAPTLAAPHPKATHRPAAHHASARSKPAAHPKAHPAAAGRHR